MDGHMSLVGTLDECLLVPANARQKGGEQGRSRERRYISGQHEMGLRLPAVGAPPFTIVQCVLVLRSLHKDQLPEEITSDQGLLWGVQRGVVAWRDPRQPSNEQQREAGLLTL
jgi:hypothetical protein